MAEINTLLLQKIIALEKRLKQLEQRERISDAPVGSLYGNEIGWSHASAAQNTWYEITDSDIAAGPSSRVTFGSDGRLTVAKAGTYIAVWAVTLSVSVAGKHVQVTAGVSGTPSSFIQHLDANAVNSGFSIPGTGSFALTAGQYLSLWIRTTDTGGPTIDVDHVNLALFRIGV